MKPVSNRPTRQTEQQPKAKPKATATAIKDAKRLQREARREEFSYRG